MKCKVATLATRYGVPPSTKQKVGKSGSSAASAEIERDLFRQGRVVRLRFLSYLGYATPLAL
jgi:hypothetical protein